MTEVEFLSFEKELYESIIKTLNKSYFVQMRSSSTRRFSFYGIPAFHVGMYIGGGKWLESPETGESVKIVPYNPAKFTSATRVIN